MMAFAEIYPDAEIVTAMRSQLSWTHLRELLTVEDPLKRQFYTAGENPPLGLILCADKNQEQIELLELNEGSVRVASSLTELPPKQLLEQKLVESIEHARIRAQGRSDAS